MKKLLVFTLVIVIALGFSDAFAQGKKIKYYTSEDDADSLQLTATVTTITQRINGFTRSVRGIPTDSISVALWVDSTGGAVTTGDSIKARIVVDYYRTKNFADKIFSDTLKTLLATLPVSRSGTNYQDFPINNKIWCRSYFTPRQGYEFFEITGIPKYGTDGASYVLTGTETILWKWQITGLMYYFK